MRYSRFLVLLLIIVWASPLMTSHILIFLYCNETPYNVDNHLFFSSIIRKIFQRRLLDHQFTRVLLRSLNLFLHHRPPKSPSESQKVKNEEEFCRIRLMNQLPKMKAEHKVRSPEEVVSSPGEIAQR